MADQKTAIPGFLPDLKFRPCCLLAEELDLVNDIPVFGHIWPRIMGDLSGNRLTHRSGTTVWGMILRREHSGTVYTCNAGFVDLGHLRDFADLTRHYFYALIRRKQKGVIEAATRFPVLKTHGGITGEVTIQRDIPYKTEEDRDFVINVARNIAYDVSVIYEIKTYGETRIGGRSSAFSPEDLVSNYLGTYVGGRAIKEELEALKPQDNGDGDAATHKATFDTSATLEIIKLLSKLGPLNVTQTVKAFDKINGIWVKKERLLNFKDANYVRRRNFHIRPIDPWLVPKLDECPSPSFPSDVDRELPEEAVSSNLTHYFFDSDFFDNTIFLNRDFDQYIERIKDHARQHFGPEFDQPTLP